LAPVYIFGVYVSNVQVRCPVSYAARQLGPYNRYPIWDLTGAPPETQSGCIWCQRTCRGRQRTVFNLAQLNMIRLNRVLLLIQLS